jgi:hypothetical protein
MLARIHVVSFQKLIRLHKNHNTSGVTTLVVVFVLKKKKQIK